MPFFLATKLYVHKILYIARSLLDQKLWRFFVTKNAKIGYTLDVIAID